MAAPVRFSQAEGTETDVKTVQDVIDRMDLGKLAGLK
jgi:hypothetical protein